MTNLKCVPQTYILLKVSFIIYGTNKNLIYSKNYWFVYNFLLTNNSAFFKRFKNFEKSKKFLHTFTIILIYMKKLCIVWNNNYFYIKIIFFVIWKNIHIHTLKLLKESIWQKKTRMTTSWYIIEINLLFWEILIRPLKNIRGVIQ